MIAMFDREFDTWIYRHPKLKLLRASPTPLENLNRLTKCKVYGHAQGKILTGGIQQKSIHDKPKNALKPIGLDLKSFHSKLKTIESFIDFSSLKLSKVRASVKSLWSRSRGGCYSTNESLWQFWNLNGLGQSRA
jgi:hypothetical protein